jgi:hypothetical protein
MRLLSTLALSLLFTVSAHADDIAQTRSESDFLTPFPTEVIAILVNTNPMVKTCLANFEETEGRLPRQPITLEITAMPSGKFSSANVTNRKVRSTELGTCLSESVLQIPVIPFEGPDVHYVVEIPTS